MKIERASKKYLDQLASLTVEFWPECTFGEELEHWKKILKSDREYSWLAVDEGGRAAGFLLVSLRTEYVEGTSSVPVGYVEGIYISPEFRGKGIGYMLLKSAELLCRKKGCLEMASDAQLHNTGSQEFHRKAGFEEVSRLVCYRKSIV